MNLETMTEGIIMKKIYAITGILLILAVALSGCSLVKTSTVSDGTAENVSQSAADKSPAAGDTDTTAADTSSEEELIATVAQTITTNGTHTITGTVNGQILVIAEDVTLILDSATINCSDGAGILGYYEGGKQNLTVELSGACSVTSAVNHGIQGKDNLIISGDGAVDITAAKDGLHAGDDLTVESSTLRITADDDGIQAGNETDGTGLLLVGGGDITVSAG
ncbi:MAG TPA: hypothetical protein DEQ02_07630, partial [Ruminococcaceae bacterium]|nr:hypothetical protein [Oscillospiraceae bacterium]